MQSQFIEVIKYGAADDLTMRSSHVDENCHGDEVLIQVEYSGVNFADIVMRLGMYRDAPALPFTPGYEISGIVKAIGPEVKNYQVGDEVMAGTRFGGYAAHIKLSEWQVLKVPDSLNLKEAAAVPVNFITAYIALNEFARIRPHDKILLDCATGGVGVYAMQMAKVMECEVIGLTSSSGKKDFIHSYGAKAYTHEEFLASSQKDFDFILNSSGGRSVKDQYDRLALSGKLCCIGLWEAIHNGRSSLYLKLKSIWQTPWYPLLKLVINSKSVSGFNALSYFDDEKWMRKHLPKLHDSPFAPFVGGEFEAKDVASAHKFLEQRKAKGKVVLKWNS